MPEPKDDNQQTPAKPAAWDPDAGVTLGNRLAYGFYRLLVSVLFPLIGPVRVYGAENIPKEGPVIFAPNHVSYADPPVVGWKSPRRIWAIAKADLTKVPVVGGFIRNMGIIPVDPSGSGARATIKAALEQLKMGRAIGIFPEGTRTRGPLGKGMPGVAMIARKSGAPVVPVLLTGTHRLLAPDHPGIHRGKITCTYGKPLFFDPKEKGDLEADTQRIMDAIAALRAVTPDAWPEIREEDLPPLKGAAAPPHNTTEE